MLDSVDFWEVATIAVALGMGGFVKGATGAGAPLVAVPVMAAFHDVTFAILVMVVPNIVINLRQTWIYRQSLRPARLAILMSLGAVPGMVAGTWLLSRLPERALLLGLGVLLVAYLVLRLVDPRFGLSARTALRSSLPVGVLGGILQGAAGMSGPLAVMFLSTQSLARPVFIGTVSAFFLTNSLIQAPALWVEGLLDPGWLALSALALVPVWLAMPVGNRVAQRMSAETFNRWILVLIGVLAVRLVWRGLT